MMFIYRSNRVFNFAQGEMATAAAFMALLGFRSGHPFVAVLAALVFSFLLGVYLEACVLGLVHKRTELSTVVITIGIYAIINSIDSWKFGYDPYVFPSPFPDGGWSFAGVFIAWQTLGILCCAVVMSALIFCFFRFTLLGYAFQAMAEDPVAAKLKGIRVGLLVPVAWGMAAVVGGCAGMFEAHSLFLHPNTMETVLLYGLAAAVIGGLQTSFGALAGGVLVGVVENLAGTTSWIGSELKTVAVYALLVAFLIVRPRGLFGRPEYRKI